MKAYVLHGIGDLRREEVARPVPGKGEVLLKVMAAGVCGSDIPRIFETGAHRHPLIPGHEFSGIVEKTGDEAGRRWEGKRVGVFPLIPCRQCPSCRAQRYELCDHYGYLGSRQDGGFAEYVAVPVENLIALPEEVSFAEAAMLEPMAVAVHAMRRTVLSPQDAVAIYGLGTIGLLLAMFLRDAGITNLFLIGNKESQRETVLRLGFPEERFCNNRAQDARAWLLERTGGADVFFECVGKSECLADGLSIMAACGRIVLIGNPHADVALPKDAYWKILRKQLTLFGTWNTSFTHEAEDDWHYVMERLQQRRIAPESLISHRLHLNELENGLAIMHEEKDGFCKIMVTP